MCFRSALCLLCLGALVPWLASCSTGPAPADLVLLNGKIVTLEEDAPEVRALAARDGKIVGVGDDDRVRRFVGPGTRVIDLQGRLAVPGLIESHGHFAGIGRSLMNLDLTGARTWEDVVELAATAAGGTEPGQWIVGWGWHQEKWDRPPEVTVEGYPTHDLLSRAVPDHPVLFKHAAGNHMGLVNARGMELAGIGPDTPDPPGGKILRDARGRATGVLRENAWNELAIAAYEEHQAGLPPESVEAIRRREIELADAECLSKGITSFRDAGSDLERVDLLRSVAESGDLGVRLWVMLRDDPEVLAERADQYRVEGAAGGHFTVGGIKCILDGALGSHGAWLLEPYSDLPGSTGLNTMSLDELELMARIAIEQDLQLAVHAIGDRANRETLDLYERIFREYPYETDPRWRIEHAQHLHPDDIPRFAELGVIASMQAVHCTSDGTWVKERLGPERCEQGAYVWRELIDSGAVVCNGTDAPIEDVDPIANFHASVTRRLSNGESFYPEQCMTREEALRSYTIDAAYAAFEEDVKGSLRPGKLADVTVLSRDILTIPEERIPGTRVLYTIVGGRVLYEQRPSGGSS
jgi:predicted amidohydrolase YtcJ